MVLVSNIFYFHPDPCGNDPIWLIFFKWTETTNKLCFGDVLLLIPLGYRKFFSRSDGYDYFTGRVAWLPLPYTQPTRDIVSDICSFFFQRDLVGSCIDCSCVKQHQLLRRRRTTSSVFPYRVCRPQKSMPSIRILRCRLSMWGLEMSGRCQPSMAKRPCTLFFVVVKIVRFLTLEVVTDSSNSRFCHCKWPWSPSFCRMVAMDACQKRSWMYSDNILW